MIRTIFTGLDFSAVKAVAECLDVNLSPRMVSRIKFLEALELKRLNKRED